MNDGPTFLDVPAFAERVGLSVHTIRQMIRDHRIAATKTSPGRGGTWLVLASEVDRLVAEAEAWRKPIVSAEPPEGDEDDSGS